MGGCAEAQGCPLGSGSCLTARRGLAASCGPLGLPLQQRRWGSGLSGAGTTEQGGVLLITMGSFQGKETSIDTGFPQGVSLEVWNF